VWQCKEAQLWQRVYQSRTLVDILSANFGYYRCFNKTRSLLDQSASAHGNTEALRGRRLSGVLEHCMISVYLAQGTEYK
jgi:hypothetical protein